MKLKLHLSRPDGSHADLHVALDADCTVGALADRLASSDPRLGAEGMPEAEGLTLVRAERSGSVTLNRACPLGEAGLVSGTSVSLTPASSAPVGANEVAAVLSVHSGPDAGRSFELRPGSNSLGRGRQCSVQLADPMVSTAHARIVVGDTIEIIDENSSNGILMGDQQVTRVVLGVDDFVVLGEDVISVSARAGALGAPGAMGPTAEFNRSPRVDPPYEGSELVAPEPPSPPESQRFPVVSALVPVLMGTVLILLLGRWEVVIFLALSPLMFIGTWWENRRANKRAYEEAVINFRANLADLVAKAHSAHDEERTGRGTEHPGTAEVVEAMVARTPLLWTRRPEHASFMELRLGLGTQASRLSFDVNPSRNSTPELVQELTTVLDRFECVDRVPVVGSFESCGSIGLSGPTDAMLPAARGVLLQLLGLHSPAEVVLCAVASSATAERWDWIKWLPHTSSDHSPIQGQHLASTPPGCVNLVAEISDLIAERRMGAADDTKPENETRVVLLVEDDAPLERNHLVALAESGPDVGVHLIWLAEQTSRLPAACRTYLEIDPLDGSAATGRVVEGELTHPVLIEPVDAPNAAVVARSLASVVDAGALPDDQSDLPVSVSFLAEAGVDLADSTGAILDRWKESRSVFPRDEFPASSARPRQRRAAGLRALVGRSKGDNTYLDLRTQGPHALVGGTTGSGKSEFLQTWIMGMATAYGPQRITFLFIDYKGGAAFADCVRLPHCVGLVTDLNPLLVRRALTSLRAELRYREHLLNRYSAKDLQELETSGNPAAPPSLVIVVDEFAALVQEVPEFVDGVVDVAQRGRSLGLHLILATQRPAGVIKDNLRANTNLRVALRMADEDDSRDVIGTTEAASFDPAIPGRAVAKTGPGRLEGFQAGYVGGWTHSVAPPPMIAVETLVFGPSQLWEQVDSPAGPLEADEGPNDNERLVERVIEAAASAELESPRRPWLPELSPIYELASLQLPRTDTDLAFGVIDDPDQQAQHVVSFQPDVDGNMAVYGTGGSGKSAFLRTLAVSAGLTVRGGPCVVYGLDFGARSLQVLQALPHVGSVVSADDHERIARLLRQLRDLVFERAGRYATAQAATITEYRTATEQPDEPRVLLLVDGLGAFRSAYETGQNAFLLDLLQSIATDGRQVGVHLVVSADRTGAVPTALAGSIQRNLVLRLASDMDLLALGAPADGFTRTSPAGRGFLEDHEVQVAVLGGTRNVAVQGASIVRLADRLRREGVPEAPEVQRLAEHIALESLPAVVDDRGAAVSAEIFGRDGSGYPVFAVADETLQPVGFDPGTPILVAGPAGSGRSTAVITLISALHRVRPSSRFVLVGQRRSSLPALPLWDRCAAGVDAVGDLAAALTGEIESRSGYAEDLVVVIEGVGEFLNTEAEYALVDLLKACRSEDVVVIAEGETPTLSGSWPLLAPIKSARHGIVLQPDQMDGDALFNTSFGRMSRADFPPGRGMYVRSGRASRVQVAET